MLKTINIIDFSLNSKLSEFRIKTLHIFFQYNEHVKKVVQPSDTEGVPDKTIGYLITRGNLDAVIKTVDGYITDDEDGEERKQKTLKELESIQKDYFSNDEEFLYLDFDLNK
jgi:hypothetical protein